MLARSKVTWRDTEEGTLYCGKGSDNYFYYTDDVGDQVNLDRDKFEIITLKLGDTVRIKAGEPFGCEETNTGIIQYCAEELWKVFKIKKSIMVLKELGRDSYITVHESAISEIIEEKKPEKMITVKGVEYSEDTLALMAQKYHENMED